MNNSIYKEPYDTDFLVAYVNNYITFELFAYKKSVSLHPSIGTVLRCSFGGGSGLILNRNGGFGLK
jgi:hypothetical protein